MSAITITVDVLKANAGVAALVGTKISVKDGTPTAAPSKIEVEEVNEDEGYMLSGASGFPQTRVTVSCIASSPSVARQIGKAVKAALNDFTGVIGTYWANFQKEGTEYPDSNDDLTIFRLMIDYNLDWKTNG
ncbi:DUF3168 domain-containing protein [Pleomorphomonas sp. PLEO]|uniref:tail completion protein gp17 n=1 Tax=Pleomorphomonas sp. PLEO TaxID=3239306 RepID=UPI00351DF513